MIVVVVVILVVVVVVEKEACQPVHMVRLLQLITPAVLTTSSLNAN